MGKKELRCSVCHLEVSERTGGAVCARCHSAWVKWMREVASMGRTVEVSKRYADCTRLLKRGVIE